MKKTRRRSDCPINFGLEIFGDKWTLLIIRDLMFKSKNYYNDFIQSEEKIATNLLADRLSMLERLGIATRDKDNKHKQKIIYKLTQKGIDLMPILIEIILWSAKYDEQTGVDMNFVKSAKKDKLSLINELSEELKLQ